MTRYSIRVNQGLLATARLLSLGTLVVASAAALTACSRTDNGTSADKTAAFAACRDAVKEKVALTANATFSDESAEVTNYGYKIYGWVEGPQVTKVRFLCSAEQNGTRWVGAQVVLNP